MEIRMIKQSCEKCKSERTVPLRGRKYGEYRCLNCGYEQRITFNESIKRLDKLLKNKG